MKYINIENVRQSFYSYKNNTPFDHCVIDNFFIPNIAEGLDNEFLKYSDKKWFFYNNAIENKKALNDWNLFPKLTYDVFTELMSNNFVSLIESFVNVKLYVDHGLHGGGWHIHSTGGNLNPHLDYSLHPKLRKLRKLNLICYLSKDLKLEHGGNLGFYNQSEFDKKPSKLIKEIQPIFNRAVIFDTTQNSWHGMSSPLSQPKGIFRKSLAVYYLTDFVDGNESRERAMFAARDDQKGDKSVNDLIELRSNPKLFYMAYKK